MITHLAANYCRLFLAGKGEEKCTHWRKALQEAKSDKVPQAYLQMQLMKQNFNELCHVIWWVMSCKSLCQLQWLGTKSFSFKINKRVLSSALPKSGTLGKKEVVIGMPCLQITAARLPSVSYNPHPPLLFKSRLQTKSEQKTVGRSNNTLPTRCLPIQSDSKRLEWL